jgi:uncharacterized protein (DUF302 family)
MDQIEVRLRAAARRHGGDVLAISHVGQLLGDDAVPAAQDTATFTLCFADLYAPLLRAETRMAAFLPSRVAVCVRGEGALLETISPRECCRLLHRSDLETLAASLEETLRQVMTETGAHQPQPVEHAATEDLVNMRAAVPQRIDCRGTKVEELAGTGAHDAAGG